MLITAGRPAAVGPAGIQIPRPAFSSRAARRYWNRAVARNVRTWPARGCRPPRAVAESMARPGTTALYPGPSCRVFRRPYVSRPLAQHLRDTGPEQRSGARGPARRIRARRRELARRQHRAGGALRSPHLCGVVRRGGQAGAAGRARDGRRLRRRHGRRPGRRPPCAAISPASRLPTVPWDPTGRCRARR